MRPHATSNRIRRHQPEPVRDLVPGRSQASRLIPAAPPIPDKPPRPFGDLSTASAEDIAELAAENLGVGRGGRTSNRRGMLWLLECLQDFPGRTWQQRWDTAGLNGPGHRVEHPAGQDAVRRTRINAAAGHAYCMRLIQPSLAAFQATRIARYVDRFRRIADDPLLNELCGRLEKQPVTTDRRKKAMLDVCVMLAVYGIDLADLTPEAVLHYAEQSPGFTAAATAWPVLYEMGQFPGWVPRTLQDARIQGQQPIEELVDRHQLRNGGSVTCWSTTFAAARSRSTTRPWTTSSGT